MAKPLSMKRVRRNIEAMPNKKLRNRAFQLLESNIPMRHGSPTYARKLAKQGKEEVAVTEADHEEMTVMYANGLTYRTLEGVFHCYPASGNDVYRCVKRALKRNPKLRRKVKPVAKRNKVKLPPLASVTS